MTIDLSNDTGVKQTPGKIWSKSFIILFFANMAFNMGLNMSNSLLSVYSYSLGASAATIGIVASSQGISAITLRFISAPIMDTYNRKYLVMFAALMMSIAFFGFSLATSIPVVIAFRLLQGAAMAFGNASCLAMVADLLPKDRYNSGLGYYSMAQVACSAVGPSVGLALSDWGGFRLTYTLTSCIMLLAAFLTFMIKLDFKKTKKLKFSFHNAIATESFLPVGIQIIQLLGGSGMSFLIIYAREQGVTGNIGLYFTTSAITMLLTRPLIGRLTDKYGLVKIAIPASICNILSLLIVARATTLPILLTAAFVSAFGQGACQPALQALTMKTATPERRGAASSTNYIGMDIGTMVGPVIAGNVAQTYGYYTMWHVLVAPIIAGSFALFFARNAIKRIEERFASR
ncbi:MAG: MFS transporter [Peptococcaceae bacterium]|jgi:MFS family permease|nr:MFS transporter [Peptococcaceae bacterium]